jgi:hypothetical protein
MNIDSDAQKDLVLTDDEADGVTGGVETTRKSTKRYKAPVVTSRVVQLVKSPGLYTPAPGVPQSANSGDDDCAPEFGGDPGVQDGTT